MVNPNEDYFKYATRLRFPLELERAFQEDYTKKSLPFVRAGIILALLVFAMFGAFDPWVSPLSKKAVLVVRYAIVCPMLMLFFLLTFFKFFKNFGQILFSIYVFMMALGLLMLMSIVRPDEPGYTFYYPGIILIIFGGSVLGRLRFKYAMIVSLLIFLCYEYVAIIVHKMLISQGTLLLFINNSLFILSSMVISLPTSYFLEVYNRRDFVQKQLIKTEQQRAEKLLLNILPATIANQLKYENKTIAASYDSVTVLFADIVNFTNLSANATPDKLVGLLNNIFSEFDRLVEKHGLEKIKTIGDAYMVAGGLPEPRPDHAQAIVELALDMREALPHVCQDSKQSIDMRIGINSGPVVAGVIGIKKFIYDLWGDTVNTASRIESQCLPGHIQVTAATYELLKDRYEFADCGEVNIKGKGNMRVYQIEDNSINNRT